MVWEEAQIVPIEETKGLREKGMEGVCEIVLTKKSGQVGEMQIQWSEISLRFLSLQLSFLTITKRPEIFSICILSIEVFLCFHI